MLRKRVQQGLMVLGLGTMLMAGAGAVGCVAPPRGASTQ